MDVQVYQVDDQASGGGTRPCVSDHARIANGLCVPDELARSQRRRPSGHLGPNPGLGLLWPGRAAGAEPGVWKWGGVAQFTTSRENALKIVTTVGARPVPLPGGDRVSDRRARSKARVLISSSRLPTITRTVTVRWAAGRGCDRGVLGEHGGAGLFAHSSQRRY